MTPEDEEFNRIEQEADMRRKAISAALKEHTEHLRKNMSEYERGFIDGMQKQAQSSVDKAVNAMVAKREWQGLTHEERKGIWREAIGWGDPSHDDVGLMIAIEAKLQEKNA